MRALCHALPIVQEPPETCPLTQLQAFTQRTFELWERIPENMREGVVSLRVDPALRADPHLEGGVLLGECVADPVGQLVPGAPVRSHVVLYHGSFVVVAEREPDFDWDGEIEETLLHELQHHLEWRAGHDGMGELEDLDLENERRLRGLPFDPHFYRHAIRVEKGVFRLGNELFLEVFVRRRQRQRLLSQPGAVVWRGARLSWDATLKDGETPPLFIPVDAIEEGHTPLGDWGYATVVVRRWRPWRRSAASLRF